MQLKFRSKLVLNIANFQHTYRVLDHNKDDKQCYYSTRLLEHNMKQQSSTSKMSRQPNQSLMAPFNQQCCQCTLYMEQQKKSEISHVSSLNKSIAIVKLSKDLQTFLASEKDQSWDHTGQRWKVDLPLCYSCKKAKEVKQIAV